MDEEKEPQFLIGRSRVNAMNFGGAIDAFEQALEMNPHSSAAHFELGWLYAEKQDDPAAAIYHYQKYLVLRPHASDAETIRQHIFRLKQELAKAVLPIPSTPELQRQLERLTDERRQLLEEIDQLRVALARASLMTNRPAAFASRSGSTSGNVTMPRNQPSPVPSRVQPFGTHKVQSGDTLASIARKYRISLESLTAANPGLDPRRMQIGHTVVIPRSN